MKKIIIILLLTLGLFIPSRASLYRSYHTEDGLSHNCVWALMQDSRGFMWFGTNDGLNRFDGLKFKVYRRVEGDTLSLGNNFIHCLVESPDGKILVGTKGGLYCYRPASDDFRHISLDGEGFGRDLTSVHQLLYDADGRLWVGCYGQGVYCLDADMNLLRHYTQPELPSRFVTAMASDISGNIWIGTDNKGLFILNPADGSVRTTAIKNAKIQTMYRQSNNMLWVGTEGEGLARFNPATGKTEERFSEVSGMPSDIVYAIEEDEQGNMWVTTGGGLVKIAAEDHSIHDYRYMENLLNIHYSHNSSLHSVSDNRMYIGGSGGFISFNPADIMPNTIQPVVRIAGFTVNGNPQKTPTGRLVLESKEATFGCDVACLSYLSPSQNVTAYLLDGFDQEWRVLKGNERHIEYMNLPWGDYTLRVKGANSDGVWSEPIAMDIHVNRPLLLSNTMMIVYLMLLITGIWLAKRRFEYLQRRKMVSFSHAKEKELYEAKIGFFTNIAHEIRTPLSLISAPLETILASGDGTDRTRHNLRVMQSNVHRLLELINQLLDFRKVEAQLMRLHFRSCDVSKIVTDICARYEEFAHLNMIKIDAKKVEPDLVCTLDPEAFEKIVGNLMSNATKFANKHITVQLGKDAATGMLELRVSDDGPGIKEKDLQHIFESFYQVDDHGKHPGSGLGLPLALRLSEMHGGTLTVESVYGQGCTFILRLPTTLAPGEPESAEDAAPLPENTSAPKLVEDKDPQKRPTVLVVEDNDQLRTFIAENLSELYEIQLAGNGIEAIRILEDKSVDLMVSDIMMPEMDGIELCRTIRSNPALVNLPIVLLSAKTDVETKVEGLNIGADAYIEKPFSIEQLQAQIKSILDSRRRLHESFIQSPLDFYSRQQTKDTHQAENAEFVEKLNQLILDNLTNPDFTIDHIAQTLCMSRSSFHSRVKSVTGETPNNYIRIVRLCKGAELLATGKFQIVEVCYMVGFNTPSYFSKCFADHFGKLPKDYINDLNNNNNQ